MPIQQDRQLLDGCFAINDGMDRERMRFAAFADKRFPEQIGGMHV